MTNRAFLAAAVVGVTLILLAGPGDASPLPAPAQGSVSTLPMSVDDVVKLVAIKIGDDVIISQIRKIGIARALSPDDLIRLKTNGVSDEVIRAMIDPTAAAAASAPVARTGAANNLPSAYGYYLLNGEQLSPLGAVPVTTTFGLVLADRGFAVDGLNWQAPSTTIGNSAPAFIVFQQSVQPDRIRLSRLSYDTTMTAWQFNILNTAPQFFHNVYRKNPSDSVTINLWRPKQDIPLQIEPVEGKTGMFKLVPAARLSAGKYALYFVDALHPGDTIFSASTDRQSAVFSFEVTAEGSTSSVGGGELGDLFLHGREGVVSPLRSSVGMGKYLFGARRVIDLGGTASGNTIPASDGSFLLKVPTPIPITLDGWRKYSKMENQLALFPLEVGKGKRTAKVKEGVACKTEPSGTETRFLKVNCGGTLPPGEYAIGPVDPVYQPGGGPVAVFPFTVKTPQ